MREERSGSTKRPLAINDDFFDRLAHIVAERTEQRLREIARSQNVSVDRVRGIASGQIKETPDRVVDYSDDEDYAASRHEMEENYRIRSIRNDAEDELDASFSITYNTGYSARGDNLAELKAFMTRESGRPETVRIDSGKGWRGTSFDLTLRDSLVTCRYEVKGERRDIDYYHAAIARLLKDSEPDYPWLHFRILPVIISAVGSFTFFIWTYALIIRLFPSLALTTASPTSIAVVIVAPILFGMFVANAIQRFYDRTFPKCQFEYGPEWRRQRSRRTMLLLLLTAIVVPIVLPLALPKSQSVSSEVNSIQR